MSTPHPARRTRTLAVGLAALALASAGCAAPQQEGGGGGTPLLASVDTHFGTVDIPEPDDGELRVVALGWSDGEVALSLGVAPVAIFDWQNFGEENKGVGPWATERFGDVEPELLENVDGSVNYEQIQALDPDVILNVRAALDEKTHERLSEIAPTVAPPKDTPDFAVDWRTHTRVVAEALGRTAEGEELIAGLDSRFGELREQHPEFDGVTMASGSKFGDAYGASLPGDSRFDIYGELGFVLNPAIEELPSPNGFYANISVEQVSAFDADVAVLTTIGYPLSALTEDPLIQSLPVVRDGRALLVDPEGDVMRGATAGTVQSIGIALDAVVPDLAAAVDKLDR
ncbi:iron-siderophore ABC transporter substrate-binding protein [Thermobifida halotolerans]|uniref:Iron-siderophore ABC transporter substrate-binding protein n=1 Tax=Thermobifida halotolerans TaxID=483545 RepID=A0A399G4V4_9ACTN|nr:iron-siderophore ABC transporter substrate-binding protein [Thermobifida halotolerans]UOE20765.1 iron-siderophore ABC transporter substrate-binding protein [Thermobifida halotolerans]